MTRDGGGRGVSGDVERGGFLRRMNRRSVIGIRAWTRRGGVRGGGESGRGHEEGGNHGRAIHFPTKSMADGNVASLKKMEGLIYIGGRSGWSGPRSAAETATWWWRGAALRVERV